MNICIAYPGDLSVPGGGLDRVKQFACGLQRDGHQVTIVTCTMENDRPKALEGVEIITANTAKRGIIDQPVRGIQVGLKAKKVARERNAILQVEHATFGGIMSVLGESDFVLDMHDLDYPSPQYADLPLSNLAKKVVYKLERRAVDNARLIIVVSTPMKEILTDWGYPEERISVIPNGFRPEPLNEYLNATEVDGRVGFIGTIHPKLNFDTFLEIASRSQVESLEIIGGGNRASQLRNKIASSEIDAINMSGRMNHEDAFSLLASCQVVIYPLKASLHTKMLTSRKIFDYAYLGKAMVLDDVSESDIWARFKSRDAAVFSTPERPEQFADAVCNLIMDPDRRETVSSNAKQLANDYIWSERVDELLSIYRQI